MKRILLQLIFIVLLALWLGEVASAQVYKWVDENGILHFTDDINQIPEKYKATLQGQEQSQPPLETAGEPEKTPPVKKVQTYTDTAGRGEDYWRAKVQEWNGKLETAQDKLEGLRSKYNELTEKYNASRHAGDRATIQNQRNKIQAEMDQCKAQIDESKEMLDKKIPEEASLFKAKSDWLKP